MLPQLPIKDGKETVSVKLDVDVQVLKQSSKNISAGYIEFVDADNKVIRKIDASYGLDELNEAMHEGEVGNNCKISIGVFLSPSEAEKLNEAIAIKGGSTLVE